MVLGGPVLLGGLGERVADVAGERARAPVHAQLDARLAQLAERTRQELRGDVGVHEQRLDRVADRGPLDLRVHGDRDSVVEVGRRRPRTRGSMPADAYITGTVACSFSAFFRPSPPRGMIRSTTPSWVASWRSSSRSPPRTIEIAPSGRPAHCTALGRDLREHRVRVRRRGRAAQHDRVARLQAQRRAVDRHVRARLVDHRHHAERHAHAAHVEPVLEPVALDRLAHRVGQRGDRAHVARRSPASRSSVELQPVEQRGVEPGLLARLHVARVRLEDLVRALLERVGHRLERGVLGARCRAWRAARGARFACGADLGYRLCGGGHRRRVPAYCAQRRPSRARSSRGARPPRSPAAAAPAPRPSSGP